MSQRISHQRRSTRALLALAFAALLGSPAGVTQPTVVARALPPSPTAADLPVEAEETPANPEPEADPGPDADPGPPSIHYEQAMAHEADVLEFEPGDRVSVPFAPSAEDRWEVDGRAPRPLPPGHATGLQMRSSPADAAWSAGQPADLAARPDGGTTSTVAPASFTGPSTDDALTAAPIGPSGLRREVFGFLPYWELTDSTTTLDWRTLSTVAYFSVGCLPSGYLDKYDADGSATTGWGGWTSAKMTSVINAAHRNHTRVVLTISCFAWTGGGASRQASVLGSATARTRLARAAAAAVRDRGADGINLDFEPIVAGYADEFTALVRSVRTELNRIAPGYQLTFDTLGSIGNQPIAEATAPGGADAVFIMGYDYKTDSSSIAGSISPLAGPRYDLTDTIRAYTARISPSKVILGVPYYGRAWSTSSDRVNASTLSGAKYGYPASPTYGQAMALVEAHGRRYDSVEQAPWTAYRKQTCTTAFGCVSSWRQLYYDDAASLRLRYDLVNRASLRGAGIWALGYDGTRPELRNALADKFLADKTAPTVGVATLGQTQRDEGFRVAWSSWDDSTLTGYDVQVSVDGGSWKTWLAKTSLTSRIYLGRDGHTYAFRVRAGDIHGNVSGWKSIALGALGVPGSIGVGGFATVLVDGLKMRSAPSTAASVMVSLAAGDALQVIGGPSTGGGYTWYRVAGPVRQWAPVDPMQVGGWVAVSGNGATNAGPRRPVYATRIDAGITSLKLNGGGARVLTPNGDGTNDTLHLAWTNQRTFDSLSLRVFRSDGTLAGTVALGGTGSGAHAFDWDGRLGGAKVPAGAYVIQLQGIDGSTAFNAPSATPVTASQIVRTGVVVGNAPATAVVRFAAPISPNRSLTLAWHLTFGGSVKWLRANDIVRSGTATGCRVAAPTGSGSSWTVTLSGCSAGTVKLALKARAVQDAVGNWGPATQANTPTLLIDRSAPSSATPKVLLRAGVGLPSTSTTGGVLASLALAGTDPGGAGIRSYDVRRSVDGAAWQAIATRLTSASLAMTLTPGHGYRFSIRARDRAGNIGAWTFGPLLHAYLPQQSSTALTWTGTWSRGASAFYSGGTDRFSTSAGASLTYKFTGRAVAWVTTLGPDRGTAKVYLDGVLVATVNTHAAALSFRRIAFARTWSGSGFHVLRIVVGGTLGHARVDVDALEVLR